MKGCTFKTKKDLKKKGRGSCDFTVDAHTNNIAIKWYGSKAVHRLSSHAGVHPVSEARRWDGKKKDDVKIPKPFAITEYNKFMRDVDLYDML